ncbi:uncharacterized protein LOC118417277 [Branchiostoma floridae]|uniref:Uncharacterized protein LOC118417277 n=1 Tax=Branchiostoma floridae TaxID=7739 RepID=A0A9J7MSW8_BRAFL|nr:uncharacterized protein LOC118417277 [Branchiostoma floridae]
MYLPFVISVEDLQRKVEARMPPGSAIPSVEWIRLQFWPTNPFTNRAVRHTFRFDVKYAVQSRVLRVEHEDSKYASTQFKYMKEFACKYREHAKMICLDDKAIVPLGEPGHPVSSGVRGHNKSLVPVGTPLVALDHDWHVAGLIPSVVLLNQVPETIDGSFHRGRVFVTTKEKVFQPSTPGRHATEVCNILRSVASSDDVNLDSPILLIYTDGGPDHRVTYLTVKLSYIALFIALDLDVLIAARCAPNGSWLNPAERVMSVLNLALQNVSLAREKMDNQFEARVKGKSNLTSVRQEAQTCPGFQQAFNTSLQPVKELVNERFRRMQLKGERIETHEAASDEQIEEIMNVLSIIDSDLTANSAMSMQAKDLAKYAKLSDFLKNHTKQTHYTFQVKKCTEPGCFVCNLCPPRLPADVFETVSFLPDPTLDVSREHYKKFAEVYGSCTTEEDRPSLKSPK